MQHPPFLLPVRAPGLAALPASAAAAAAALPRPTTPTSDCNSLTSVPSVPSVPSPSEKRYSRLHISLFRSASGAELPLPLPPSRSPQPRTSSVTDASLSPAGTHAALPDDASSASSTYSHASAVDLDGLLPEPAAAAPAPACERARGAAVARSFAKARRARQQQQQQQQPSRQVVLAPKPLQPANKAAPLAARAVRALAELLDMNAAYAAMLGERVDAFRALYSADERRVLALLLGDTADSLRDEAPTPWRSPLATRGAARGAPQLVVGGGPPRPAMGKELARMALGKAWGQARQEQQRQVLADDALVRGVVYGAHVARGKLSGEALLLRMAGEFQRDEVNRKASRAERMDVPLSFAMTLTGLLGALSRLECSCSFRRRRSRSAAHRRGNPQAVVVVKSRSEGVRLSFAVTLHGEGPCTVLFRRPMVFSQKKLDEYAAVVTEAKDVLAAFGRDVTNAED